MPLGHRFERKLTFAQKQEAIDAYVAGDSCPTIAKRYGMKGVSIWSFLKRSGVKMRTISEAKRVYCLDQTSFANHSPECHYWIGFLLADGSIDKKNALSVRLSIVDHSHLEKLRVFLKSNHPIAKVFNSDKGYGAGNEMSKLYISSQDLCRSLESRGVHRHKTAIAQAPSDLKLDRDFWRGMVDGDGWVCTAAGSKERHPVLGLTGTQSVCESFLRWAQTVTKTAANVTRNNSIFKVALRGRASFDVVVALYESAGVSLERKMLKASEIISTGWRSRQGKRRPPEGW